MGLLYTLIDTKFGIFTFVFIFKNRKDSFLSIGIEEPLHAMSMFRAWAFFYMMEEVFINLDYPYQVIA